jgi:L-iditol 2-dehydrogenase
LVLLGDISGPRLGLAKDLIGEVETIESSKADVAAFVQESTGGRGADVIITACPVGETHTTAMEVAAIKARISLFGGIPGNGRGFLDSNSIHYKELSVFGSHASSPADNRVALERISAGEIRIGKYISAFYPLDRIEEAFEALKSERVLKIMIRPSES